MTTFASNAGPGTPHADPSAAVSASHGAGITPHRVVYAMGDGIGPEVMRATLGVLESLRAPLELTEIVIGQKVYEQGCTAGIAPESWDVLRRSRVFLKAPITTPRGGGYKSLNVTTRKSLGLFANVRPCVAYSPFVASAHPGMDVVIVRENEEDTYAGIEHRQTAEVTQCLKLITRPGCEKIVRYAFEYARIHGREKVTCFTKDNIMKATDGLFLRVFHEIAEEYPDIGHDNMIIDIGTARLADTPGAFDVIVTPNLYGDIISDVAAQISGSVGLGGSANVGEHGAMFEAIHGSAPDIAGQDKANPSGLLLASVQMLVHLGLADHATTLHNAWLRTIEDGVHTGDIASPESTRQRVGTGGFAEAVTQRLGESPRHLPAACYTPSGADRLDPATWSRAGAASRADTPAPVKELVGVDVFVDWDEAGRNPDLLADRLQAAAKGTRLKLKMITNRGVKVWPQGLPETFKTDHWRCRFTHERGEGVVTHRQVVGLLTHLAEHGIDFIKTEHLCTFDGEAGYSMGQGE